MAEVGSLCGFILCEFIAKNANKLRLLVKTAKQSYYHSAK
jgi:hypothetical protein